MSFAPSRSGTGTHPIEMNGETLIFAPALATLVRPLTIVEKGRLVLGQLGAAQRPIDPDQPEGVSLAVRFTVALRGR